MSLHRDRYLASAAFFVAALHRPGGRRIAVFDRTVRWKSAAKSMRKSGKSTLAIACALGRPRSSIDRVLSFGWRF